VDLGNWVGVAESHAVFIFVQHIGWEFAIANHIEYRDLFFLGILCKLLLASTTIRRREAPAAKRLFIPLIDSTNQPLCSNIIPSQILCCSPRPQPFTAHADNRILKPLKLLKIHSELQLIKRQLSHCNLMLLRQAYCSIELAFMTVSHIKNMQLLQRIDFVKEPLLVDVLLVV
jgi:hypothetical protein